MNIRWLGHASFLLIIGNKKLITDPFDEQSGYAVFKQEVDIATVSHEHWDHNSVHVLAGSPRVIKGTGFFDLGEIKIKGVPSFHDKTRGKERGTNTIYKISAEGIDVVHLGDLGHLLEQEQVNEIGNVDILLLPVGGIFTIDAEEAFKIAKQLDPKIIIPMHFGTPHLSFNLAPVEPFIAKFDRVVKMPYLEVNEENLKDQPEVIVLDYMQ